MQSQELQQFAEAVRQVKEAPVFAVKDKAAAALDALLEWAEKMERAGAVTEAVDDFLAELIDGAHARGEDDLVGWLVQIQAVREV